jgi:hypothetical protein
VAVQGAIDVSTSQFSGSSQGRFTQPLKGFLVNKYHYEEARSEDSSRAGVNVENNSVMT